MKKERRLNHLRIQPFFRSFRRIGILFLMVSVMIPIMSANFNLSAANVSVNVNGSSLYSSRDLLKNGVTYVPLRSFANAVYDGFSVSWSSTTKTATIRDGNYVLKARVGDKYITVNGQRVYSTVPNLLILNRIHVPIRSLCTGMGLDVVWNSSRKLVSVRGLFDPDDIEINAPGQNKPNDNNTSVDSDDLYWLARIIHAESQGEPMAGKIAVGTVVMNRVKSSMYPNTVYGVIFDKKYGTQFTPVATGTIYNTPNADSVEAARRVLSGERTDPRILFFVNERIATSNWISQNRTCILTIGNHKFYA